MIDFDSFYINMGFSTYPFRDKTAEKEDTKQLFINPGDYNMLIDAFKHEHTCIINGNRGAGKTIIEKDLESKTDTENLICVITNYEQVGMENNRLDYYSVILQEVTKSLSVYLLKNKLKLKKLKKDEKILISFLLNKYGEFIADSQLKEEIENIQLSTSQKILNIFSKPLVAILNYFSTAVTNFGNELLTKNFGRYLPVIDEKKVKEIFPEIKFKVVDDFKTVDISYSLLSSILKKIHNIVGTPPVIFMDKFDEDSRIQNDADILAKFSKDLLCDNNLLMNEDIQIILSMWEIAFKELETSFRQAKHYVYNISWNQEQLKKVLNQRLSVFSKGMVTDYKKLFSTMDIEDIFVLCNSNPRDLWDILDNIFRAQYEIDASCKKIYEEAVRKGLNDFVRNFHFYEYYPRKKKARKNTNDIYSYIKHLLKLNNTIEFTNNELREVASTGGSTTNYITGMMKIGLIKKTDKKRPGGAVIYRVNDPKVIYAISNKIEILHR